MLYSNTKPNNTSNNIAGKFKISVYKALQFLIIWASISILSTSYADTADNSKNKLSEMSCKELLEKLVTTSPYGTTFLNKQNNMGFYFERSNNHRIGLTFVKNASSPKEIIFANSEIDLANATLKLTDPEGPTFIEIHKKYIPYIASKCTSDKNEYRRGKSPDPKYDGIFIERHERWNHPVLAVFEKYGFLLNKVSYSQDGKFPTFYVTLKYPLHIPFDSKDFNKIYFEIIKANSYFPSQRSPQININKIPITS